MSIKPVCLIIRDGWGKGADEQSNAIFSARTPFTDAYERDWPTATLQCSGLAAGLPEGYQGNSEVGHLTIGAGRIVYQSLSRIDKSIEDGDFFSNPVVTEAIESARTKNATLHLMGLVQEEGVHAVTRHCHALLSLCRRKEFSNVVVHAITDGRDTPPRSALEHLTFLQEGIDREGVGRVATVIGRYYAMDRDRRWDRTHMAYDAIMRGKGKAVKSWKEAVEDAYAADQGDEFIQPRCIDYEGAGENDVFLFFNFRFDRTRQLTQAIAEPDFEEFATTPHSCSFFTMTHYYDNGNFKEVFPERAIPQNLGEVLSGLGLAQLRCAETEKYAHVTFFFNSLRNDPFPGEERILVDSPRVATYDLQPEMSAPLVRDKLVAAIASDRFDVVICNFANGDMVGHTGVYDAVVKAVETVDACVHDVVEAVLAKGGAAILCADHGNAEQTRLPDGSPMTAHTTLPVPVTVVGIDHISIRSDGALRDLAPTMLDLLEIEKPAEMDGSSLILRK